MESVCFSQRSASNYESGVKPQVIELRHTELIATVNTLQVCQARTTCGHENCLSKSVRCNKVWRLFKKVRMKFHFFFIPILITSKYSLFLQKTHLISVTDFFYTLRMECNRVIAWVPLFVFFSTINWVNTERQWSAVIWTPEFKKKINIRNSTGISYPHLYQYWLSMP
jgi:hypothetical protein